MGVIESNLWNIGKLLKISFFHSYQVAQPLFYQLMSCSPEKGNRILNTYVLSPHQNYPQNEQLLWNHIEGSNNSPGEYQYFRLPKIPSRYSNQQMVNSFLRENLQSRSGFQQIFTA